MRMFGKFNLISKEYPNGIILPNTVVDEGEAAFLKMLMRDDQTIVAGAGNFYIGLCGQVFTESSTLASLAGQPSAAGGYARQPVIRSAAGWPTQDTVNGSARIRAATVNFTATGADFSTTIWRAFICSVLAGSVGTLFAVSAALPTAKQIVNGETFSLQYDFYLE